jgi:hypothetical protein
MPEDNAGQPDTAKSGNQSKPAKLKPALEQLGTALCPICKRREAVYLTKTQRPFINCGYCAARVFYNGRESMRILRRKMKPVPERLQ